MNESSEQSEPSVNFLLRWMDRGVIVLVKALIVLAELKSRDPHEHPAYLLKPDPRQQTRIRNWQGVLRWSPQKRVGCFAGVLIGIAIGTAILWYGLKT